MKMFFVLLCAMLVSNSTFAQSQVVQIKGKIIADLAALDGIYVINKTTEASTETKIGGYFLIAAKAGDTLLFSSTQTVADRIVIQKEDLEDKILFVKLNVLVNRLDEVVVTKYRNITSEQLGLVPYNQKRFTPSERKYNTASNPYEQIGLGAVASFDPVLNWMSGRTAMLKKEMEIEKKENWLELLESVYDSTYVMNLHIPSDYVAGFYRYCVENVNFVSLLRSGNRGLTQFHLAELAQKYLEIISLESK